MRRRLLAGILVFGVACSKKEEQVREGEGSTPPPGLAEQPRRSFDPNLSEPAKVISALEIVEKKVGVAPTGSPVIKGRETGVANEILEMADGDAKHLAMVQLMSQWAASDIEAAMFFGATLEGDFVMKRAFHQGVAPYLSEHQPEVLLDIIGEGNWWPDQWITERAALQRVAATDFERAAEFLTETAPAKQHKELAYRFARQIAEAQSTEAAFEYADRLSSPKGKPGAIRAAVAHWVEEDSIAASRYARDAGDPLLRDHAILGLVDGLWQTNPEDTVTWTASINDAELRGETYTRLARTWQRYGEAENVEALLSSPDLSPTERASVQEGLAELAADTAGVPAAAGE